MPIHRQHPFPHPHFRFPNIASHPLTGRNATPATHFTVQNTLEIRTHSPRSPHHSPSSMYYFRLLHVQNCILFYLFWERALSTFRILLVLMFYHGDEKECASEIGCLIGLFWLRQHTSLLSSTEPILRYNAGNHY